MSVRKWVFAAAGAAFLLAACFSGCSEETEPVSSAVVSEEEADVFPEGTSIGGKNVSGRTVDEALEICREAIEETIGSMEISVRFRDDAISLTGDDFETSDVLELTLPELLEAGEPGEYQLSYVTDLSASGEKKLWDAANDCVAEGKNAAVSGYADGAFTFTDEQKGSRVDMDATMKSVRQLLSQKHGGAIQASFIETNPRLTKQKLSESFKLLSTYSTVSTNTANGNSNMALALSHVNGTILQPGQTFSYNDCIGDSTDPAAGWKTAGGLVGGVSVQVYGGGICQGSTTLYNAALLAGMEIVERECHSTPSTYCPIGLDATVDYGYLDFRFRNPLETPVYIGAWMEGVTLHVSFFGCLPDEWDKIAVGSEQTGSEPALTTVGFREDEKLEKGQYVRLSSGYAGYSARAWRTYYKGEKVVKTEELASSVYKAAGVTYAVGPGTDTKKVDVTKESGTVGPDATPSPSPSPTPEPTPDPAAEPGPEPTSESEPTPEPEPSPEAPAPTPEGGGEAAQP